MFDVNPETHRFHLADLEREMQRRRRPTATGIGQKMLLERMRNAPAALAVVCFVLGGFAGGTLL